MNILHSKINSLISYYQNKYRYPNQNQKVVENILALKLINLIKILKISMLLMMKVQIAYMYLDIFKILMKAKYLINDISSPLFIFYILF